MRRRLLISAMTLFLGVSLPGCQLLLDLLSGGGGAEDILSPGGDVTVRLENHSGFKVIVDAKYTSGQTQVRTTTRVLEGDGPGKDDTILATRTEFLDITAKLDPSVDPAALARTNLSPGEVLALGHFEWGVDFHDNEVFVFIIPAINVPPTDIVDCDGDGISDADELAACETGDLSCQDCNGNGIPDGCDLASETSQDCQPNGIPDECDIGELVPAIVPSAAISEPRALEPFLTTPLGESLTPQDLVNQLIGDGVSVSNVQYHGDPLAAGSFIGGLDVVGFNSGIVLSSGKVSSIPGPNTVDNRTYNFEREGDSDLDNLLDDKQFQTNDAAVLEFDFSCEVNNVIQFHYVFSSEEYNEFIESSYNDVFAFFLNGENIAMVPGTFSTPVAIQTINCGATPGTTDGPNCNLFVNNACYDIPPGTYPCAGERNTEMDGLTVTLTATGTIRPGTNHIKIAIADTSDFDLDSAVFLQGVSFVCQAPRGACCDYQKGFCIDEVLEQDCNSKFQTWSAGITCEELGPPCAPVPQGACCMAEAYCVDTTAANCYKLGGCYLGDEQECASATCTNGLSVDCDSDGVPDECKATSQPAEPVGD
jgi:hypothetical protein